MKLYIVVRHGVYMQGIYGVYDTHGKALVGAREAKSKERDDYHTFKIEEAELNKGGLYYP